MMTLGPTIALIPLAERARGWIAGIVTTFGRVPMFYYLLHIPLIHAASLVVWLHSRRQVSARRASTRRPYVSIPPAEPVEFSASVSRLRDRRRALYVPCRWYARAQSRASGGVDALHLR